MDINIEIEKVMDRQKVADTIHTILDTGVDLLKKESYGAREHAKIKVLRTMGTHVNGAVSMIQQENAQVRAQIVVERLKQLGYNDEPKQVA